jgi:hypothetical protein
MKLKAFTIAAAIAFPAAFVATDIASPQYHPLAEPVSRYVNTSAGWLVVLGMVSLAAAAALTAWQMPAQRGLGRIALGTFAAAVLIAAVFPADPPGNWSNPSLADMVHGQAAMVAIVAFPIAAVLLSRGDGPTTALAWVATCATLAMAVTLVDVMTVRALGVAGLPSLLGLTERIALVSYVAWLVTAVTRTKGVAHAVRTA